VIHDTIYISVPDYSWRGTETDRKVISIDSTGRVGIITGDDILYDLYGDNKPPRYIALKSNLLYDVLLLPNVAIEYALKNRYSVEAEAMYSWWKFGHRYHRIRSLGVEARKWLGKDPDRTPLTGHYVGAYAMGGTYNLRLKDDPLSQGVLSRWSYSFGLTYGYSMPIARRLNLEFGVGIGYLGGEYHHYNHNDIYDNHYPWLYTRQRNYIGLTKAKVSLVWLIGSGINANKNTK
jgi:hypothetical protein